MKFLLDGDNLLVHVQNYIRVCKLTRVGATKDKVRYVNSHIRGKCFCVCSQAEDVRQVVDSELGFQQVTLSRPTQAKTYLFINTERLVVGCVIAEPLRQVGMCS